MFAAAAFTVIVVADRDPSNSVSLVVPSDLTDWLSLLAGQHVNASTGLTVERVCRAHEHVVAELVQMPAITQPRAGRRDVVGRRLAFGFDQHRHVYKVFVVPRRPRLHQ